ncbi:MULTISPECIES: hypothetical protein [unclassified Paenibacillus]|uniref:hypothetical protein n=1 Tax=unclassified Paenibacillus TaxID=185978 RepID=UPI0009A6DC28|nr:MULTISPECIES: hypothetical protein [unclassified Paenibacillus]SLK13776.1 hypothetical protein SAMN06272722_108249 [Paenibacillus sp. RU5A]SOC73145.1 hypothetical protein SAMN05880581_108250 [Paenibacillus sp. RU26A]SOC75428.1 hypothetical protein SAMN05880586_108249 [Paenibacillus sp. RU5M]
MDTQLITGTAKALNAEATKILVTRLRPAMLFLIVMTIITLSALWIFNEKYSLSMYLGFWTWFIVQLVVISFGLYALLADVRVQMAADRVKQEPE